MAFLHAFLWNNGNFYPSGRNDDIGLRTSVNHFFSWGRNFQIVPQKSVQKCPILIRNNDFYRVTILMFFTKNHRKLEKSSKIEKSCTKIMKKWKKNMKIKHEKKHILKIMKKWKKNMKIKHGKMWRNGNFLIFEDFLN